jgi:prolyl-tRNA editing enzyme YbaK/EbsC (Cys-tRNA(Pro) deacylase)
MDNQYQTIQEYPELSSDEQDRLNKIMHVLNAAQANYSILTNTYNIRSADEGVMKGVGQLEQMAPTFLIQSERGWICAIISGKSRLSYKKIKKQLGLKNISLAKPDDVELVTGAKVGTVSLINPGLSTIVDSHLMTLETVYGGCGVPRHTLQISVADLVAISQAQVFEFADLKTTVSNG